ncbi:hypothetical protein ROA7450_00786 [Roseovarius albus]|uniref:Stf0 sulfotransferase n=1 Tax=Roseovarius albus TaxID=1247867 RepID=A0A1X6YIN1_9RHOB|nr:hypothetical protein [Roseovarius albus]SLN21715.1 hypothetical protein ROA7450_00786 [Roseovarius albus]
MGLFSRKPCVIVASMGRSGSTMLTQSLSALARKQWHGPLGTVFGIRPEYDDVFTFEESLADAPLTPGIICKTHDYPDDLRQATRDFRAVYIFGSAYESALSVHSCLDRRGADWVEEHFRHLKSTSNIAHLFDCDALNMARNLASWATFDAATVLCIRYETLWDRVDQVAEFTGYRFQPPPFEKRAPKAIEPDLAAKAHAVYDPIDAIIETLPDIFMSGPEMTDQVSALLDFGEDRPAAQYC